MLLIATFEEDSYANNSDYEKYFELTILNESQVKQFIYCNNDAIFLLDRLQKSILSECLLV